MPSKTSNVVVVPGAWSVPAMYRKLAASLEAKSFKVHVPALPTNNAARPPNSSYEADVAAVRAVVEPLVSNGEEVVLLMHSYGGAVGTSAVQGLGREERQAQALPGGVVHLLYLSAYLLAKGQCLWTVVEKAGFADAISAYIDVDEDGTWALKDPLWAMYHDLEAGDQDEQMSLVVRNNMACVRGEVTYEAWKDIPSTYVSTAEDRCVPVVYQEICLANAKNAGVSLDVVVLDNCAHSAYVKCPERIVELVTKAISPA